MVITFIAESGFVAATGLVMVGFGAFCPGFSTATFVTTEGSAGCAVGALETGVVVGLLAAVTISLRLAMGSRAKALVNPP
jgi:hypothetical protein